MYVLTVDQRGSRRHGDRVAGLLEDLTSRVPADAGGVVRPFERTVGDEVQAVLDDADVAVDVALTLLRIGGWSVGIGVGSVDEPLPVSARAGSGEAFIHARAAVERAKSRARPVPLAVVSEAPDGGRGAEAVLTLLGSVVVRRSAAGWAVIDAMTTPGATQDDAARRLGISQQAVSQRLRAALWAEEVAARPVAARLLAEGDG
ncbi:hypothetical protein [Actinotalea fermentans]|uniref:DNA-binding protein n=1 Tax=Actinotalea fermentans TaxID=43671 RepID=A0A511YUJ1_9CELL|nr:hypothetical protein [Actinotalea fermentans]KGM17050.1 hypothetical protein N867_10940 [Actinotalea fermentans ATCC 43279 = JCM 9966 = DSM 3133]GEN78861.1 hypothetical protein AFE02nite_05950 [Actinotalea fermentans]